MAYNPTQADITELMKWESLIQNTYQNGPMPEAPEALSVPTNRLPALPAGVTFDPSGTGAVFFTESTQPTQPWFWDPAKNSVAKGSVQYANIALNCQYEQTADTMGTIERSGMNVTAVPDPSTGNNTYVINSGSVISPTIRSMPYCIDDKGTTPTQKALAWITNQVEAWKEFGPTGRTL